MKLSEKFEETYKNNQDMKAVILDTNNVMSSYFLEENNYRDREILYETIYGFKQVLADEYSLSMDNIYKNVAHLDSINLIKKDKLNPSENDSTLGYFDCSGNVKNSSYRCSVIAVMEDNHKNFSEYKETLTHELVHLFSQRYTENELGEVSQFGDCGLEQGYHYRYVNEIMTQKISMEILDELKYDVKERKLAVDLKNNYVDTVGIVSHGMGYSSISPAGQVYHELYSNTIYSEMFDHTNDFTNELEYLYGKDKPKSTICLNTALNESFNNGKASDYIELYRQLSDAIFTKVDVKNIEFAEYLNILGNINSEYGCALAIGDANMKALDALCTSKEIEHFYQNFNPKFNPETDLEKEINPITRSKNCTDFLIIINALKDMNLEYETEKLEDLTYKQIVRDGNNISLSYTYDDTLYLVSCKKDLNTGLISIEQNDEILDEKNIIKPSIFKKLLSKETELTSEYDFEFISKMSKISDYSDVIVNTTQSPEKVMIHAMATSNNDAVHNSIKNVDISNILDSKGNNLLHILSSNQSTYKTKTIINEMCNLDIKGTNAIFNAENNKGKTPIDIALFSGNLKMIDNGCLDGLTINNAQIYDGTTVNKQPLLHHLHNSCNYGAFEQFIKGNADIDVKDNGGNTIVHLVAKNDDLLFDKIGTINALIKRNANPDVENKNHLTPLMEVCKTDGLSSYDVKYLCDGLNANPNYKNSENRTAIHYLMHASIQTQDKSHVLTLEELITSGADVNMPGKAFRYTDELVTPLQIATGAEYLNSPHKNITLDYDNITTLVKNGANINRCLGDDIPSPLEMAHYKNDVDMLKSFIDGGVKMEELHIDSGNLSISTQLEIVKYSKESECEAFQEVAATREPATNSIDRTLDLDEIEFDC